MMVYTILLLCSPPSRLCCVGYLYRECFAVVYDNIILCCIILIDILAIRHEMCCTITMCKNLEGLVVNADTGGLNAN